MLRKSSRVFDRDIEWDHLVAFASPAAGRPQLGVVSGRRRQGKTYLGEALARKSGGCYFGATQATESESLRLFADAVGRAANAPVPPRFLGWDEAIRYLFAIAGSLPGTVVNDEFPYLSKVSPALPSILQREIDRAVSEGTTISLILCGSAMSVMGGLLAGSAPLRGRATLELVVRYLLEEAADVRATALYHSVLTAVANGNGTRGGIASYIGRRAADIGHHLTVLEDCELLRREPDVFRSGRSRYRVAEPLITFYQVVMHPQWGLLESGRARPVWQDATARFSAQVLGAALRADVPGVRARGSRRATPDPVAGRSEVG